jgi:hypothetical protein
MTDEELVAELRTLADRLSSFKFKESSIIKQAADRIEEMGLALKTIATGGAKME